MRVCFVDVDAAAVRSMAVADRFHDSQYANWIRAGQALICTAEGIYDFCDVEVKKYHRSLHRRFPRQPCDGPCQYVSSSVSCV